MKFVDLIEYTKKDGIITHIFILLKICPLFLGPTTDLKFLLQLLKKLQSWLVTSNDEYDAVIRCQRGGEIDPPSPQWSVAKAAVALSLAANNTILMIGHIHNRSV